MSLVIKELTHIYMEGSPFQATAIHDVTAAIEDGEFIGLIGHTGSGKSTLIQHLNGLLKPTSGTVLLDGVDMFQKNVDLKRVRMRVGLVFQYPEYQLFEETVIKDIRFGPVNLGLSDAEATARALEAARLVGVPEALLEKSPFELSGGEKRRVAIAGVLAIKPDVLILDEPVAGLDPRGREEMLGVLKNLHDEQGITIVMVSHSMDDVLRLCTRLLVMNHGRLQISGAPREVFQRADELYAMGLDVPEFLKLKKKLDEAGFPLEGEITGMESLERAIVRGLRGVGA